MRRAQGSESGERGAEIRESEGRVNGCDFERFWGNICTKIEENGRNRLKFVDGFFGDLLIANKLMMILAFQVLKNHGLAAELAELAESAGLAELEKAAGIAERAEPKETDLCIGFFIMGLWCAKWV